MAEAVYNAAGLGLPIVMTIGNRAIGAPINIWNDHSDSMSMRDAGWIQLFAETNQEALDLHIQAFRLAEELSCPVMVCMDGFILTHAYDRVDMPTQAQVDAYLPPFEPRQVLDPADPVSIGAMVGPEAFTEVRYLAHHKQLRALDADSPASSDAFATQFGRDSGGLIRTYRTADAETIVVALGSVNGTVQEVVDEMRDEAARRSARYRSARSGRSRWPRCARRCSDAKRVVVLEKCLAVGLGGIVSDGVRKSLSGIQLKGYTVIAGLGGRAITRASLQQLFEDAARDELEQVTFLDLNADVVAHELERESRRGAPDRPRKRSCAASEPSARASVEDHHEPRQDRAEQSASAAGGQVLPDRHVHRRQPAARRERALGAGRHASAPTRSIPGTAPARAAARRWARATRSTPRCARRTTS